VTADLIDSILRSSHHAQPGAGHQPACCATAADVLHAGARSGRAAVNNLYNTIVRDSRHREVMLLQYRENRRAALRRLDEWAT